MDEGYVKIENNNYDIDSLFNFQSNFDQLKFVIMALATAQKKTNDRIALIEQGNINYVENYTNINNEAEYENDIQQEENSDGHKTPIVMRSPMKNSMISN